MPDMDGYELLEKIKLLKANLPVVSKYIYIYIYFMTPYTSSFSTIFFFFLFSNFDQMYFSDHWRDMVEHFT